MAALKKTQEKNLLLPLLPTFGLIALVTGRSANQLNGSANYARRGQSRVYCLKCQVCLCLSNERNCFFVYHTNNGYFHIRMDEMDT